MQQLDQNGELLNESTNIQQRFLGNKLFSIIFFILLMFSGLLRFLGISITLNDCISCAIIFFIILETLSLLAPRCSTKGAIVGMLILSWSASVFFFFSSNVVSDYYHLDSIINYFYINSFVLSLMYIFVECQEPRINGGVVSSNILITALAAMAGGLNKLKVISLTQQAIACLASVVYLFVNLGFILVHFLKTYSNTLEYSEKD